MDFAVFVATELALFALETEEHLFAALIAGGDQFEFLVETMAVLGLLVWVVGQFGWRRDAAGIAEGQTGSAWRSGHWR